MNDARQQAADTAVQHEAAMVYAQGESRAAINVLIARVNSTNGHCDPKIWLMLLDIYRFLGQQAPYEKLAVFFSNRFHCSPPAWDTFLIPEKKPQGQWRNALVVEGSILDVNEEKIRDFIRASKEHGESRLDISRMRIDPDDNLAKPEMERLYDVMGRLRRVKPRTLLMGETALVHYLNNKISQGGTDLAKEQIYWFVMLELLQWRGQEEAFEDTAMRFVGAFDYCPVGYDPQYAIAVPPQADPEPGEGESQDSSFFGPGAVVTELEGLVAYAQHQWSQRLPAEISLTKTQRVSVEAARDLAAFLQAQSHPDGISPDDIIFSDVPEIVGALLEVTGVAAYSTLGYRHAKLRNILEKNLV